MPPTTLIAVATCHNRRRHTLACLARLSAQSLPPETTLDVILVDDGSTDGTGEAVRARFPDVTVLDGPGDLYWAGGMRVGFDEARRRGADYYLWLNDDTRLHSDAVRRLLATHDGMRSSPSPAIIIGATTDSRTGKTTYGGRQRSAWWHPLKYDLVPARGVPARCDVMNGNCVLIPDAVARIVGTLDEAFTHAIADYDYAMRARAHGVELWTTGTPVGTCATNSRDGSWEDASLPLTARWQRMQGPKGLPLDEWTEYARRYAGPLWPLYAVLPVVRLLFSAARRS